MKRIFVVAAILSLFLFSCSREPGVPEPTGPFAHLNLYLFSAPWCHSCNEELPQVDNTYKTFDHSKLKVLVYVVNGKTPSSPPTPEILAWYKSFLGVDLDMEMDPHYKIYRKYFEGGLVLPTGVVLTDDGQLVHRFYPPYEVSYLFQSIQSKLK